MEKLVRLTFAIDKRMANLGKFCSKELARQTLQQPYIETTTGVIVATSGRVLVAYKMHDYQVTEDNGLPARYANMISLPIEITKMKGTVTLTVEDAGNDHLKITATDEHGVTGVVKMDGVRCPNWRSVMPRTTGYPVEIDAKVMEAAIKRLLPTPKARKDEYMRMFIEKGSDKMVLSYEDCSGNHRKTEKVEVALTEHPLYRIAAFFCGDILLKVLTMKPTVMRFVSSKSALLLCNDEAAMLAMPMTYGDDDFMVTEIKDRNCLEDFDVDSVIEPAKKPATKSVGTEQKPEQVDVLAAIRMAAAAMMAA